MLKKQYTIIIIIIAVVLVGLLAVLLSNNKDQVNESSDSTEITEQVREDDESISKVEIIENSEPSSERGEISQSDSDKTKVKPFISYAGVTNSVLEVNSYVPVSDLNGKCTISLEDKTGNLLDSRVVDTLPDATTTVCKLASFNTADIGSDEVLVNVSYASSAYKGVSDPFEVTIP